MFRRWRNSSWFKIAQLVKRKVPGMTRFFCWWGAANRWAMLAHANKDDFITSNHRGHGQVIARNRPLMVWWSRIRSKYTGTCKGKGVDQCTSPTLWCRQPCANGIYWWWSMGIAVGAALTQTNENTGKTVVRFFGDGATNEGVFHEAVNMASIWNLQLFFYCINNGYGISADIKKMTNVQQYSRA